MHSGWLPNPCETVCAPATNSPPVTPTMQMMSSVTGFVDDTGHVGEFIGSQGVPEYWTSCFLNLDQSRRAAASIRMITHRLVLSWEHFVKFARTASPLTTARKYFSIKKSRWTHKKDNK